MIDKTIVTRLEMIFGEGLWLIGQCQGVRILCHMNYLAWYKKGEITPFYINRQKEITTKYAIFVNENTYLSGIC